MAGEKDWDSSSPSQTKLISLAADISVLVNGHGRGWNFKRKGVNETQASSKTLWAGIGTAKPLGNACGPESAVAR
jgi:hypothetical protein